jgi:D-serine deaminase-like pyridoxal phosphate-dependent protein
VSALVESASAVDAWQGRGVALFVDVNPGMNRTGVPHSDGARIVEVAQAIVARGIAFGGIHYYDGHLGGIGDGDAERVAHEGYDRLLALVADIEAAGVVVPEIITAGTPAFPWSLSYDGFTRARPVHRASPGTIVYGDATSAGQLPAEWDLVPAAVVAATVVSVPTQGRITCDAGHKTVSADAGVPTCVVLGRPDLVPGKPSEEHLPIAIPEGARIPDRGDTLYLLPRHVCPTVNNFDAAVIVKHGRIADVELVAARGREGPLAG